jgi:flagellar biosynthesis protein FlgN
MGIVATAPEIKPNISFELDARLANQLLEVMQQEQTALIHGDIDAIEGLLTEKSTLLQRMNLAVLNRYEDLSASGFEGSEAGMNQWLKQQANPNINRAWNAFKKTLIEAKEINRLNGLLINRQFNLKQQTLQQLQGNMGNGETYGRSGKADLNPMSRTALSV